MRLESHKHLLVTLEDINFIYSFTCIVTYFKLIFMFDLKMSLFIILLYLIYLFMYLHFTFLRLKSNKLSFLTKT